MYLFITLFALLYWTSCLANENLNFNDFDNDSKKQNGELLIEVIDREDIQNAFKGDVYNKDNNEKLTVQEDFKRITQPKTIQVDTSDLADDSYFIYSLPDPDPTAKSSLDQENHSKVNDDSENLDNVKNYKSTSNYDDNIINNVWRRRENLVSEIKPEHRSVSTASEENTDTELKNSNNNKKSNVDHDFNLKNRNKEENFNKAIIQPHIKKTSGNIQVEPSQKPRLRRRRRPNQGRKNIGGFKTFPPKAHPSYRQNLRHRKRQQSYGSRHHIEEQLSNLRTKYYQPQYDITKYDDAPFNNHWNNIAPDSTKYPGRTNKQPVSKENENRSPPGDLNAHDSSTDSGPDDRLKWKNPQPLDSQADPSNLKQSDSYLPSEIGQWINLRHEQEQHNPSSPQNLRNENRQIHDSIPIVESQQEQLSETQQKQDLFWKRQHDVNQQQRNEQQYEQQDNPNVTPIQFQYNSDQNENIKYKSSSNFQLNPIQIVVDDGELAEKPNIRNQGQQSENRFSKEDTIEDLFSQHFFPGSSDHTQFPSKHSAPAFQQDSLFLDYSQENFQRPPLSQLAVQHLMHSIAKTPELPPESESLEVIKHVPYPVVRHVMVPIPQPYAVPVPHAVRVAVPRPYPVHIEVEKPVPYPVVKLQKIFVEKKIPYPVERLIPYAVDKPYPVPVIKKVHIPVEQNSPHSSLSSLSSQTYGDQNEKKR